MQQRCRRDEIPLGLVAVENGEILGTIALGIDLATGLEPSVIGLLVKPSYRRRGIATALLERAVSLARKLGYRRLFTSTTILTDLLVRTGWQMHKEVEFANGETGKAYAKEL